MAAVTEKIKSMLCRIGLHPWRRWAFADLRNLPSMDRCPWCGRGRDRDYDRGGHVRFTYFTPELMDWATAELIAQDARNLLDLSGHDPETLARWMCDLNAWNWPDDFPMARPDRWDELTTGEIFDLGINSKAVQSVRRCADPRLVHAYCQEHYVDPVDKAVERGEVLKVTHVKRGCPSGPTVAGPPASGGRPS